MLVHAHLSNRISMPFEHISICSVEAFVIKRAQITCGRRTAKCNVYNQELEHKVAQKSSGYIIGFKAIKLCTNVPI
jgi:hypothetical protein